MTLSDCDDITPFDGSFLAIINSLLMTRLIERRAKDEATGEVVSLVNKMSGTKMGDRYNRSKPLKSDEKREKRQKRDEAQQKFKVIFSAAAP